MAGAAFVAAAATVSLGGHQRSPGPFKLFLPDAYIAAIGTRGRAAAAALVVLAAIPAFVVYGPVVQTGNDSAGMALLVLFVAVSVALGVFCNWSLLVRPGRFDRRAAVGAALPVGVLLPAIVLLVPGLILSRWLLNLAGGQIGVDGLPSTGVAMIVGAVQGAALMLATKRRPDPDSRTMII